MPKIGAGATLKPFWFKYLTIFKKSGAFYDIIKYRMVIIMFGPKELDSRNTYNPNL